MIRTPGLPASVAAFADNRALVASAGEAPASSGVGLNVSVFTAPHEVAATFFTQALAEGTFSHVVSREFYSDTAWASVDDFASKVVGVPSFSALGDRGNGLFVKQGDAALAVITRGYSYEVFVAAKTAAAAARIIEGFDTLLPPPEPVVYERPDNVMSVTFWAQDPQFSGALSRRRDINVHRWAEVSPNYPAATVDSVSKLITMEPPGPDGSGKLILLHGPPGTGKTRLVLTLVSEWRAWASPSVVTDADRFFGDATYMNDIVFGMSGAKDWLVLVIEDGDEYLNVGAASTKGQAISRLLNVADGIIGQGINLLTIMSTNIATEDLNPAVRRPGRCLADLTLGAFPANEAAAWCAERGATGEWDHDPTLAEMYSRVRGDGIVL